MAEVISKSVLNPSSFFNSSITLNVFITAVVLAVISLFIWRFYKSTSKRNLIKLDLYKYNRSEHPILNKILAITLYLIEYIVIMPILIVLWFAGLSIVLFLIAPPGTNITTVLFISSALITSLRILAYFNREIAQELGKLFPFIALGAFIFSFELLKESSINALTQIAQISEIPELLSNTFSFIFVILLVEIILRLFFTIFEFWESEGGAIGKFTSEDDEE